MLTQQHTDSPTRAPAAKRRRVGPSSPNSHRDDEDELTQDGTEQTQTLIPSGALDLYTPAQEAAWDEHVAQALQQPKEGATSDASDDTLQMYGAGEAALSKEQLHARHLQQITRLAQVYQVCVGCGWMLIVFYCCHVFFLLNVLNGCTTPPLLTRWNTGHC